MDGTADAILFMAALSQTSSDTLSTYVSITATAGFTYDHGAIIRGSKDSKRLAIVFTGDEFGDGLSKITNSLGRHHAKASFFFTGRFYRDQKFASAIRRLRHDGHYLGPHSNTHLLYADWTDRSKTLVSRKQFVDDLDENYAAMKRFGILRENARYFLPPFEWHNNQIADWTASLGLTLINFTPGSRSNADYKTPYMTAYRSSQEIYDSIVQYEAKDPNGLNGFILLLHAGTDPARTDKFYDHLDDLLNWLRSKRYDLVRVDKLFSEQPGNR
jgi:peptidoglycan/xylan/chitin deacetylase (PgdA/CDA1 family)